MLAIVFYALIILARKVTEILGDMQENGDFFAIFYLEDAPMALLFRV